MGTLPVVRASQLPRSFSFKFLLDGKGLINLISVSEHTYHVSRLLDEIPVPCLWNGFER